MNIELINSMNFYEDTFTISKYFPFYNLTNNTLSILIFDFQSNKILLYHSSVRLLMNEKSLNNTLDLTEFDSHFDYIDCIDPRKT